MGKSKFGKKSKTGKSSPEESERVLLVQYLGIDWTKRSRGAPGAVVRSKIPEALEFRFPASRDLPGGYSPKSSDSGLGLYRVYQQSVRYSEWSGFEPKIQYEAHLISRPLKLRSLEIELSQRQVSVVYCHRSDMDGGPTRKHSGYPKRLFDLGARDWGQVKYNGRFAHNEGGWSYKKVVANIAWVEVSDIGDLDPCFFENAKPRHVYSDMVNLF